ncbi:DUF7662 domain-containing protein [Micromonospora purpureochromogenes]
MCGSSKRQFGQSDSHSFAPVGAVGAVDNRRSDDGQIRHVARPPSARTRELEYSLDDVSALVPGGLPRSAYQYEAWWANGDGTQSRSWGDAGYEAHPDLGRRRIRFVPTGRQAR